MGIVLRSVYRAFLRELRKMDANGESFLVVPRLQAATWGVGQKLPLSVQENVEKGEISRTLLELFPGLRFGDAELQTSPWRPTALRVIVTAAFRMRLGSNFAPGVAVDLALRNLAAFNVAKVSSSNTTRTLTVVNAAGAFSARVQVDVSTVLHRATSGDGGGSTGSVELRPSLMVPGGDGGGSGAEAAQLRQVFAVVVMPTAPEDEATGRRSGAAPSDDGDGNSSSSEDEEGSGGPGGTGRDAGSAAAAAARGQRRRRTTQMPPPAAGLLPPPGSRFTFAYRVRITNKSDLPVQVLSRHWAFADARGRELQAVPRGSPGVVGQKPVLQSGESFEYVSGVVLPVRVAQMSGALGLVALPQPEQLARFIAVTSASATILGSDGSAVSSSSNADSSSSSSSSITPSSEAPGVTSSVAQLHPFSVRHPPGFVSRPRNAEASAEALRAQFGFSAPLLFDAVVPPTPLR